MKPALVISSLVLLLLLKHSNTTQPSPSGRTTVEVLGAVPTARGWAVITRGNSLQLLQARVPLSTGLYVIQHRQRGDALEILRAHRVW